MLLQTLFHVGEFEYSLIQAHQGFKKRRTIALEHGILQGNETIEDCVGRNNPPNALELLLPWIRKLEEHRKLMIEKLKEEVDELHGIENYTKITNSVYASRLENLEYSLTNCNSYLQNNGISMYSS